MPFSASVSDQQPARRVGERRKRDRGHVPLGWRPVEGALDFVERCPYERKVIQLVQAGRVRGLSLREIQERLVSTRLWPRPRGRWVKPVHRRRGKWPRSTLARIANGEVT